MELGGPGSKSYIVEPFTKGSRKEGGSFTSVFFLCWVSFMVF